MVHWMCVFIMSHTGLGESVLWSCLNVKELVAQMGKWLSCVVIAYLYGALIVSFYHVNAHSQCTIQTTTHKEYLYAGTQKCAVRTERRKTVWYCSEMVCQWHKIYSFRFQFRYSQLNYRYDICFEQGIPWHSGNDRV